VTIRVLVADDHDAVRLSMEGFLSFEDDLEVVASARDGAEAVALAREVRPDVCVLDVRMPNLDGIQACAAIRAETGARVVLLTAYEQAELEEAGREAGAARFLLKGVLGAQLAEHVREVASCRL
jgi:DNA-binding NarL/FixJ family response regulator